MVDENGRPQPGVPFRVEGPQGRTPAVTDEQGKWSLYNLVPGSYRVVPEAGSKELSGNAGIHFEVRPRGFIQDLLGKDAPVYEAPTIKLRVPH